jgi:hypothetical protein
MPKYEEDGRLPDNTETTTNVMLIQCRIEYKFRNLKPITSYTA